MANATSPSQINFLAIATGGNNGIALTCDGPAGDFCHDCRIDLFDFATLSQSWLTDYSYPDLLDLTNHWLDSSRPWER